jgi:anti-sigma-K factor RskA
MNTPASSDHQDLRCAEYVLGVLSVDERREIEFAMQQDPGVVQSLVHWQARLMPLNEDLAEQTPPEHLWERVQSQLGWTSRERRAGLWNSLSFWRWAGLTSFVAACVLAVGLTLLVSLRDAGTPAPGTQYLVATLQRPGAGARWTATVDAQHGRIVVVPAQGLAIAANQSAEMWMIPAGSKPVSLGVFDTRHPSILPVAQAQLQRLTPQTTLAVTLEPHGGSPTGQPTGPVLAVGTTDRI